MESKDLFLVNFRGDPLLLREHLRDCGRQTVYFGAFLPEPIRQSDPGAVISAEFLDPGECDQMDAFVWRLTQQWYRSLTDLGRMVEYDLQVYLFKRIKNLVILSRLISRYHPRVLYCCDNIGDLWPVVKFLGKTLRFQVIHCRLKGDRPPLWEEKPGFKEWLAGQAAGVLDLFALRMCKKNIRGRAAVWIDAKLWSSLGQTERGLSFIPCILGRGLRQRWELLKKGNPYFSLRPKMRWGFSSLGGISSWRLWRRIDQDESFRKTFCFNGLHFYPMIRPELKRIFLDDFPRIKANQERVKKAAKRLRLAAVLLRNEDKELEKSCVVALKSTEVRSIVLQHGIFAVPIVRERLLCDINAVWGIEGARYLSQRGAVREKCVVVGNPEYDPLVEPKSFDRKEEICCSLKLDPSYPLLVFASQRPHSFSSAKSDDEQQKLIVALLDAVETLKEVQCIIKVHPFDDQRPIQRLVSAAHRLAERVRITQKAELFPLLGSCDLVIVHNSTVGLSAMLFSKPVIVMNFTGREDTVPYVNRGAAAGVYDEKELVPAIEKLLWKGGFHRQMVEAQRGLIADQAFKIDGKAKERLLALLSSVSPSC